MSIWLDIDSIYQPPVKHSSSRLKCINCNGVARRAVIKHTPNTHQTSSTCACLVNARQALVEPTRRMS